MNKINHMKKEIWKEIPEYNGFYQISNLGRVKSISRKMWNGFGYFYSKTKMLKPAIGSHGYYTVNLYNKSKQHCSYLIHRLIAKAFISNTQNKPYINHINNIRIDNRIKNLEWVTQKENINYALRDGYMDNHIGENNHTAKLTKNQVIEIRQNPHNYSQKKLAIIYNVRPPTISKIILKQRWKHI